MKRDGVRRSAPSSAAWKIALLVAATGAVSASVLSLRAQRLHHAHVATAALDEARELERTIERARVDIARLSAPDRVRRLVDQREAAMGPLLPPASMQGAAR